MSFLINGNNQISEAKGAFIPIDEVIKFSPTNNKVNDVFLRACFEGNLKEIKKWLKDKKTILLTDHEGRTPLMLASACNNEFVFKLIFQNTNSEKLHALDTFRQNVLHYACYSNRLNRVKFLRDKKVEVVCSAHESIPDTFTTNPEIEALIKEDCDKVRDQQKAIMQDVLQKYPNDMEKQMEEVYLRTGRKMQMFDLSEFMRQGNNVTPIRKNKKDKFLTYSKTKEEVKEMFNEEIPLNLRDAAIKIEQSYGFEPNSETISGLLKEMNIKTKSDVLNDPLVKRAIADHFKENPPNSLQEASQYIFKTYKCRCRDDILIKFLAWCGVHFEVD